MREYIALTPEQLDALSDADPVLSFVRRVNLRAVKNPCWETDFRRAHYDAFVDEAQNRMRQQLELPRARKD